MRTKFYYKTKSRRTKSLREVALIYKFNIKIFTKTNIRKLKGSLPLLSHVSNFERN